VVQVDRDNNLKIRDYGFRCLKDWCRQQGAPLSPEVRSSSSSRRVVFLVFSAVGLAVK
jgi:hypothetical protein